MAVEERSEENAMHAPIEACRACGMVMVWHADGARKLRLTHGIVGTMAGTLPEFPQQNSVRGLPLLLSAEEARVCVSHGFLQLIQAERAPKTPSIQGQLQREEKEDMISAAAHLPTSGISDEETFMAGRVSRDQETGSHNEGEGDELIKAREVSSWASHGCVEIPLICKRCRIPALMQEPQDSSEKLRYAVMYDLHFHGYRVTDGTKFGADFLAYPGDPSLFHSQFAVRIVPWNDGMLGTHILAAARVALSARKRLVIASVQSTEEEKEETENVEEGKKVVEEEREGGVGEGGRGGSSEEKERNGAISRIDGGECSSSSGFAVSEESSTQGPFESSSLVKGSVSTFNLNMRVIYTTIATDLEFVPFEARTQQPNRTTPTRTRRGSRSSES